MIDTVYPKAGSGRSPVGIERKLRIYFLQNWLNLSDPAVEEALYDSLSMRKFIGIDLGLEGAPDETTVCKFCHPLEQYELGNHLFLVAALANLFMMRCRLNLCDYALFGQDQKLVGLRMIQEAE